MNKTATIIIGLILIAGAFYGGMKYDQSQTSLARQNRAGQFATLGGFGGRGGRIAGGEFVTGQIISKDANGITLELMGTTTTTQGSTIVFISSSTTIAKMTSISLSDLVVGQNVTVTGSKNSDGSISANSIQIRQVR